MDIFPEEILAKHRCKIDQKKLERAPLAEWETIRARARSVEVLRAHIAQINEAIARCRDVDKVFELRDNARNLQDVLRTIFPTVRPYLSR